MPILVSLLLAGQSAPMATPFIAPPPIMVTNSAPPMANPILAAPDLPASPPVLVDIRVDGEGATLWQGSLRVGPSASYSENRSESRERPCSPYLSYDQGLRSSLMLNLTNYVTRERPNQFSVSVSWNRPATPEACGEPGSRSVQLQQSIELAPGAEAVLHGDGGLAVRLRRR
jgi:hypothetical protein